MEKEVSRWLSHTFGDQHTADHQLSAACKGNLKSLWEFCMANYKTSDQKRNIQNVLEKHRRDQEAARRAPELQQIAQQKRKHLLELHQKAAALGRTLASLQATCEHAVMDDMELNGELGLLEQDKHETFAQADLLADGVQRIQDFLPTLQARLDTLQHTRQLARARCCRTASNQHLNDLLENVQQVHQTIRAEVWQSLHSKRPQLVGMHNLQQLQQLDQQAALLENSTAEAANAAADGNGSWDSVAGSEIPGSGQQAFYDSLPTSYRPSGQVMCAARQLLQEPPDLLLSCSRQLAAQAIHQLNLFLDDAERVLLAPIIGDSSNSQGMRLGGFTGKGTEDLADSADQYSLPWTFSYSTHGFSVQQQPAYITPEQQVKERQKFHIHLFLKSRKVKAAVAASEQTLTQQLGRTPVLQQQFGTASVSLEAQVAHLLLRAETLRRQVGLLECRQREYEQDVDAALKAESQLQDTWQDIQDAVQRDQDANKLLWQVASDNLELFTWLCNQQDEVLLMLREQLLPNSKAAVKGAEAGKDEIQREGSVVSRLPVTAIGILQSISAAAAAGLSVADLQRPTVLRLDAAAQRICNMGRPTTAAKAFGVVGNGIGRHGGAAALRMSFEGHNGASGNCVVDSAAVSVMRALAAVDPMAPVMCPGSILKTLADERQRLQQAQGYLQQLGTVCNEAASNSREAEAKTRVLQKQVDELRAKDLDEVAPYLEELLIKNQGAQNFAHGQMAMDMVHWQKQPSYELLPKLNYEGKNCAQWLGEVQMLHVKRRNLTTQSA